jgi:ABC-2 type transport system permease protein
VTSAPSGLGALAERPVPPPPLPVRPLRGALRALPTMLRVHFAEVVAWRAEMLVWVLAYTMPLIMLALWSAVAREAPVGRFGEREFRAYFLATLVFRLLVASWAVWEMNIEIREGNIAARLLRPIHPLLSYAAQQASAFPMRIVLAVPIVIASLLWIGTDVVTRDPVQLLLLPLTLVGAWAVTFLVMVMIGSLAFRWESALGVFDLWLGLYFVFSGYLMPLELLPDWLQSIVRWLPFPYMLAFPVENALGLIDRGTTLRALSIQWSWAALLLWGALASWRNGVRRYSAYGG